MCDIVSIPQKIFLRKLQEKAFPARIQKQRGMQNSTPAPRERRRRGRLTTLEFDRLVRQYQGLVYTVCHQLVPDVGEAQDLTQETFLAAWRSIDRCPPGFEKQWLARIASNKAKDYLRSAWVRRVNTPGDEVLALEGAPPESDPEQQVLETLGEEELTRRILALREPYKTPCRLMLLEQHTGPPLRQAPENRGGPGVPGQKDAGRPAAGQWGGSPAETGKEEPEWMKKNWNCSGRTDA